jgi:uncharacterized membrane protein
MAGSLGKGRSVGLAGAADYHPRIGELARPLVLIHVLAAFLYGAGYIGTNLLTELARRTDDAETRRYAVQFSGVMDRVGLQLGGALAGITGIVAVFGMGYSLVTPWVLAAIVIYVVITAVGIGFWGRVGRAVERAMKANDEARAIALLRSPLNVAVSRAENVLFIALIALMVLRPGS